VASLRTRFSRSRLLQRLRPDDGGPSQSRFDDVASPWASAVTSGAVSCNICRWSGEAFEGVAHSESALCPDCGSIARDRFLFFCMQQRMTPALGSVVLETSPRLDADYRSAMSRWFDYTASDFDEDAHRAGVKLDLQSIALPDSSIDVILTPHVLEHVPDTDAALREIGRVLRPGGRMFLQVPLLQGRTAPPETPEFHGDDTPVFWRFGHDLTGRLRAAGFDVALLVTASWHSAVVAGELPSGTLLSPEFDVADLLVTAIADDLAVVADATESTRHGFEPSYMFTTWECIA
jgi:SAM-dependent methyltransferase